MVIEKPVVVSSRRKRSILYAGDLRDSFPFQATKSTAVESRASFQTAVDVTELERAIEVNNENVCLIVFEPTFPDLLISARAVVSRAPYAEIILLADQEEQSTLRKQLGIAPRLGSHWQFLSPSSSGIARILRTTYQKADQRRSTRTTLDRFNARISVPSAAADTQEFRQLVISDRFLSSILDSAFDAVLLVSSAGIILSFNPSAVRLFGRSQEQAISYPIESFVMGAFGKDVQVILQSPGEEHLVESSFEKDGEFRNVELSATPVLDREQNQIAVSFIIRDVTARLQSEQALRTNEKLAAVGRLASSIAHEINNPLEAVTNLLYLVQQSVSDPEVQGYLARHAGPPRLQPNWFR